MPIPAMSFSPDSASGFFDLTDTSTRSPVRNSVISGGISSLSSPISARRSSGSASSRIPKASDFCSPSRSTALSTFWPAVRFSTVPHAATVTSTAAAQPTPVKARRTAGAPAADTRSMEVRTTVLRVAVRMAVMVFPP